MLFNELYALTDGGTFWGRQVGTDKKLPASFALLECFDYAYYGTLDVRFYASLPLLKFWPDIDKQVLREFADTVPREWPEKGLWVWKTRADRRARSAQAEKERRGASRPWRARRRSLYCRQSARLAGYQRLERPQLKVCADGLPRLRLYRAKGHGISARDLACRERSDRLSAPVRPRWWSTREQRLS